MNLTKADLALDIEENIGYPTALSKDTADILVTIFKKAIFNKQLIYIPKHMKIGSSIKSERPGRNPKTGKDHMIAARHSIRATTNTFTMDDKLTKSDFIEELTVSGYLFKEATILVETFYKFIGKIRNGENRIEIRGLGTFRSELRKANDNARNPKTGAVVVKEAYYQPMFKCSDSLRKAMDKEYL